MGKRVKCQKAGRSCDHCVELSFSGSERVEPSHYLRVQVEPLDTESGQNREPIAAPNLVYSKFLLLLFLLSQMNFQIALSNSLITELEF